MSIFAREEDQADLWLREHDPYYTDKRSNKKDFTTYAYETPEQEHRRKAIEIPFSNLNSSQKMQVKAVAGAYGDDGEFSL